MKIIPCTIQTFSEHGEDFWIVSVPPDAVAYTAAELARLLSGDQPQILFRHRKADFIVTANSATLNNRRIPITKQWLECLEQLFSTNRVNHIDSEFADKHGTINISIFVK